MLIRYIISIINAAIDKVQVIYFNVSSSYIVRVLILLLSHYVRIDVVEWTV